MSTQNTTQPGDHPLKGARFLTVQEAAEALRVSKMTVYRMVHDEELPSIRVGRSFRVPEHAVHEYLREAVADRLARNTND
ncbi:helix-turn-helix domain-containing protein [Streptomyces sp. NE5-10]|uniref:helix-turn-helix domain-containing protein n=1 Tax=Streptomyces sp. NE5-10 TaxID=2759674 RepID=UPI001F5B96DB|nr:helix-turn-helix domain-containing protein [Streptomyces sp. NE5-10]